MTDTRRAQEEESLAVLIPRGFGFPGAVMLSWMIAGGVLAGGFLVAYATLGERMSGHGILYTAGGLYLFGSLIGAVLGGALGMFGRPVETAARRAFRDQMLALLYALPALFMAFVLTGWIAMTVVAITAGQAIPLLGVALAYLVGFAVVAVAIRFGWFGARRAWERFAAPGARRRRSLRLMWVEEEVEEEGEVIEDSELDAEVGAGDGPRR
jgi:hypothetical protein